MQTRANEIKLLICDVDGVLTNGTLYFCEQGETLKIFHVQDGLGLQLLRQFNIEVAIISSRNSPMVQNRLQQLGVKYVYQGQKNKLLAYAELKHLLNLEDKHIAYAGDDLPDLACMQQAGFSIAVANAVDGIKNHAHWQTSKKGGKGAVREIAEFILMQQGKWAEVLAYYSLENHLK